MANFLDEEKTYFEEDSRKEVIDELETNEEIDATLEVLEEEIEKKSAEPEKDTSEEESEPEKASEKEDEDTSEESPEKTEKDEESSDKEKPTEDEPEEKPEDASDDEFKVTDEFINKQPEENREIFEKYKGKSKADLAKAAANAVALKNPYLKGNEAAINAVAKDFEKYEDDKLFSTFVETQRETGKPGAEQKKEVTEPQKVELPTLPEQDPKVQNILSQEVSKRLKKKYPEMPDDRNSEEYKEWERDLMDEGLEKSEQFLSDLKEARHSVKGELQKVVYAQTNLTNLYNNDPSEILPFMTDDKLPMLKQLNDNYKDINNNVLQDEVKLIEDQLRKVNLSLKDLDVDFGLKPDKDGVLYSDVLSPLMYNGNEIDSQIIKKVGKIPLLNKGQLAKKFIYENNALILNKISKAQKRNDEKEIERLQDENLNSLGGDSKSGKTREEITSEKIKGTLDDAQLDKAMESIESKYD